MPEAGLMESLRTALKSKGGKILGIVASIGCLCIAAYAFASFFKGDTPDSALYTTYVCTETGKSFRHKNVNGEVQPILSPYSGKNTGFPGEACYWNADGSIKTTPTWVLLNDLTGTPGPTFCPDCGRLVVGHNPKPEPESQPPPTQAEYSSRHASRSKPPERSANLDQRE